MPRRMGMEPPTMGTAEGKAAEGAERRRSREAQCTAPASAAAPPACSWWWPPGRPGRPRRRPPPAAGRAFPPRAPAEQARGPLTSRFRTAAAKPPPASGEAMDVADWFRAAADLAARPTEKPAGLAPDVQCGVRAKGFPILGAGV